MKQDQKNSSFIYEEEREKYIFSLRHERMLLNEPNQLNNIQEAILNGDFEKMQMVMHKVIDDAYDIIDRYCPDHRSVYLKQKQLISVNVLLSVYVEIACPNIDPRIFHVYTQHFNTIIDNLGPHDDWIKIMDEMIREYCLLVVKNKDNNYSQMVREALWYLSSKPEIKINASILAELLYTNESSLSKKFHREVGVTITEYRNNYLMELASFYLKKPDATVKEVASSLGFRDPGYFSKMFIKHFGMTPSAYINS